MKKLYRFSAIALLVLPLVFTSCSDYLDRDDDDNITEADVFARYEKVNGLVSDVYAAAKKADRPLVFFEQPFYSRILPILCAESKICCR